MSPGKTNVKGMRLFVAADPPETVCEEVNRWAREVAGHNQRMRPVPVRSGHITLAFLGQIPESQAWLVTEAVRASAGEITGLALGAPTWLPRRRARVLALEINDREGQLKACQSRVAGALQEAIGWRPNQTFLAHLTAIRLSRGFRPTDQALPASPSTGFSAESVTLYASRLLPEGAEYEALETVTLGKGDPRQAGP